MATPTVETLERITETCRLLVEGAGWEQIAKKYGYANAASACTTLTQSYPGLWHTEYEAARAQYMAAVEAEAALTQRALLRPFRRYKDADGNDALQEIPVAVSQSAAHSLLSHAVKDRAQRMEISGPNGAPIALEPIKLRWIEDDGRDDSTTKGS